MADDLWLQSVKIAKKKHGVRGSFKGFIQGDVLKTAQRIYCVLLAQ